LPLPLIFFSSFFQRSLLLGRFSLPRGGSRITEMYPGGHAPDLGDKVKISNRLTTLSFQSKSPRLRRNTPKYNSRLEYDAEQGLSVSRATLKTRSGQTSRVYANMKSPVSRFGAKTASQREWEDRLNNLDYATGTKPGDGSSAIGGGAQFGKYKTVAANVEASAQSLPKMRGSRQGYRITSNPGEQLTGDGRPRTAIGSYSKETLKALQVPDPTNRKRQPVRYPARIP
jgi:hypothetical protein